jgi:DedD protein
MAKSISDEELQLKKRARRRLVGAVALVTVVAVFLPMLLENEPKPVNQDISVQIPAQNSGTFTSKIVPVTPPVPETKSAPAAKAEAPSRAAESADSGDSPPVKAADSKAPEKATPAQKQDKVKPKAADGAKPAAKEKADAPKSARSGFVVQVAALNDSDKAKAMQQQIAGNGLASYTEVVPTTKGSVTRVRVGPFASRQAAEKARDQLKAMGLPGNVIPPK